MPSHSTFSEYSARLREFISRQSGGGSAAPSSVTAETSGQFNQLALTLFALQFYHVPVYRRYCEARGITPENTTAWSEIPAIPAAAFKECALSSLSPAERTTVFHSSGTTTHKPSRHFHNHESLEVYEASLLPWFQRHVLPEVQFRFIILTPGPALAPHSSLVHMFETVRREFAPNDSMFVGSLHDHEIAHRDPEVGKDAFHRVPRISGSRPEKVRDGVESVPTGVMESANADGGWILETDQAWAALTHAASDDRPVVLLGTAFSFVELLDWMIGKQLRLSLPPGSRALETGGYKGRSRALPKAELHGLITDRLGIRSTHIVCEYGMSELSSQAYDRVAGAPPFQISNLKFEMHRTFRFPPWSQVQIVSPETGKAVDDGETGLIRIYDLANVRSVMAIQTEDLGIRRGEGFELVGRAAFSEPRGCSLMSTAAP